MFAFFWPIQLAKPVLKKKNIFHPSSQAPAQARARSPGPRPGPLRRRMENLNLRLEKFEKIIEKIVKK